MWFKKIFKKIPTHEEDGQGLVEYALILVLVAVVAIAILLILGPTVGNVFSRVVCTLQPGVAGSCGASGPITSITATNDGLGGLSILVTVSTSTNVSLSGSVSGATKPCNPTCSWTYVIPPAPDHGSVTATGGGGSATASW